MARHIPPPPDKRSGSAPQRATAQAFARDAFGRPIGGNPSYGSQQQQPAFGSPAADPTAQPKEKAVDALGRRAGELSDEIDFPAFVASLVHGTFDAIVDSSIRQTEAFAELVSAVSKPLDEFARDNVTEGQTRGWLVEQYPDDLTLVTEESGATKLAPYLPPGREELENPAMLRDFGLDGYSADAETLESELLPRARERMAQQRLSTLANMVLMGMQRIVVKDGMIDTSLRFRAAARDRAAVDYATGGDTQSPQTQWGSRGTQQAAVKVATVDVNAQSDTQLQADIRGKVRINFASDYVPLERFVDEAQRTLLERHSRRADAQIAAARAVAALPAPAPAPAPAPTSQPTPVTPAPGPVQ